MLNTKKYNKYQFIFHYNLLVLGGLVGQALIQFAFGDPIAYDIVDFIVALTLATAVFIGFNK